MVETIDLYSTLVDLCQPKFQQTEHPLDGVSLKPILTGQNNKVRDYALSYWNRAVSVRGPSHRLIATMKQDRPTNVELYDLSETPDPLQNLAKEKPELVQQMLKAIPEVKRERAD